MEKSQENKKCSCVGDDHTCGKVDLENEGVENLGSVLVGVRITSCEGNVPVEQEHESKVFIESGVYANYPYVCTPITPETGEAKRGKDRLLVPTVSVLGSDGSSLEGSSETSPDADATSSSSEVASNIPTPISTKTSEDPSQSIPKEGSMSPEKKSTIRPRPTDINVGQRTTFHEFSGSEQGDILKSMQYVMPDNQDPPQRCRRATDPTQEARPEDSATAEESSSSDSKSISSTGSCATSFETLTGSSSVSEDAEAEMAIQRMRSRGPKVSVTFNVGGDTSAAASDTVDTLATNPSTGGVDSSMIKSVESTNVQDAQQASNPSEDVLQVGSNDEGIPGIDVPENVNDSKDILP